MDEARSDLQLTHFPPERKQLADRGGRYPTPYSTGSWTSIAVDSRNNPHISFEFSHAGDLYYAWYESITDVPAGGPSLIGFVLHPAVPNPTSAGATIGFALPREGKIGLSLYGVLGRKISTLAKGTYPSGEHSANVEGLSSGI